MYNDAYAAKYAYEEWCTGPDGELKPDTVPWDQLPLEEQERWLRIAGQAVASFPAPVFVHMKISVNNHPLSIPIEMDLYMDKTPESIDAELERFRAHLLSMLNLK